MAIVVKCSITPFSTYSFKDHDQFEYVSRDMGWRRKKDKTWRDDQGRLIGFIDGAGATWEVVGEEE